MRIYKIKKKVWYDKMRYKKWCPNGCGKKVEAYEKRYMYCVYKCKECNQKYLKNNKELVRYNEN